MSTSGSVLLPVKWQWEFMVKTKDEYCLNDFNAEFVPVTEHTNDFKQLIVALNDLPRLDEMYSANIALFREGVESKWEHMRNQGVKCVEFTILRSDMDSEGLNWFFTVLTTICLLNKENAVNGLYIRIKSDENDEKRHQFIFQVWVNNQPGQPTSTKDELVARLQEFAGHIVFADKSRCGEPSKQVVEDGETIKFKGFSITDLNNKNRYSTARNSERSTESMGRAQGERDGFRNYERQGGQRQQNEQSASRFDVLKKTQRE